MFSKHTDSGYSPALPGVQMKTLCHGGRTLMTEFVLDSGSQLPLHSHPYEQTGYLVRGWLSLLIDGQKHDVSPGDSWCIPPDVEHGATCIEDSVAVEVFSPVREDYLALER
jgi:quercetin dioxygenase-like cupin family protein